MTGIAYFSDFIRQHRGELPNSNIISSFADEVAVHINTIASDYMRGNFTKWVEQLLEPNTHGITISRQEAVECVATLASEKERIIGLTRLFAAEVSRYDRVFGAPTRVAQWDSSNDRVQRASFLIGLAIGSVPDFYEQETQPASKAEANRQSGLLRNLLSLLNYCLICITHTNLISQIHNLLNWLICRTKKLR